MYEESQVFEINTSKDLTVTISRHKTNSCNCQWIFSIEFCSFLSDISIFTSWYSSWNRERLNQKSDFLIIKVFEQMLLLWNWIPWTTKLKIPIRLIVHVVLHKMHTASKNVTAMMTDAKYLKKTKTNVEEMIKAIIKTRN